MDEVEALADDLVILHNGRSVIESISVEEMKRLQGGSRSEPSLEDAFFNFIASEKAKEEQEEEEDDNIVVSLEEVDSAASEHNEDATEEDDENEESSAPSSRTLARAIFSVEASTVIGTIWRRRIAQYFYPRPFVGKIWIVVEWYIHVTFKRIRRR